MHLRDLINRVDQLLNHGKRVLETKSVKNSQHSSLETVDEAEMVGFRSACLSFINQVYGNSHPHYIEFKDNTNFEYPSNVQKGLAILSAIREEINGGWLISIKTLISSEIFSEFIEMADHLNELGYKDPAAVMTGSVLESHLRQLCKNNLIDTEETKSDKLIPKKADRLNNDLAKNEIYTKLDQKQITTWLELRNNAAHGKYNQYTKEQVNQFIKGLILFMSRVPE